MSKSKTILVLLHEDLIPSEEILEKNLKIKDIEYKPWETEYYVCHTLRKAGHRVIPIGAQFNLSKIRDAIDAYSPDIVFNLLEEFYSHALFDQNIVSYLELLKTPYTGCNPRGLILGRDKALSKKILTYHRIKAPKFFVVKKGEKLRKRQQAFDYPLIVKCLNEEASLGIAKASVVHNAEKLKERIIYLQEKFQDDVIVEEFIEGEEYYMGIFGNQRLKTLPLWKLEFGDSTSPEKEVYSETAKFSEAYRKRRSIKTRKANINDEELKKFQKIAKRVYKALGLSGYARIDFRVKGDQIYVLEANPNPGISPHDEFALSAKSLGINYSDLLDKLVTLGLSWSKTVLPSSS